MSSGCYLALHVTVSVAGCYNPGPEIKCLGGGGYFCVEGISREALRLGSSSGPGSALLLVSSLGQLRMVFILFFSFLDGELAAESSRLEYYTFSHRMHNKHAQPSAAAILPCSLYEIQFVLVSMHPKKKKAFLFLSFKKIVLITPRLSHDVTSSLSCFVGRRCGQSSSYLHCKYPVLLFQV